MSNNNNRDVEKKLGQQYAQLLKESAKNPTVYQDCKEVIQISLSIMEHYNRLGLMLNDMVNQKSPSFARAEVFSGALSG
jgi:hypothetical protein